jgi:hypothetical protein
MKAIIQCDSMSSFKQEGYVFYHKVVEFRILLLIGSFGFQDLFGKFIGNFILPGTTYVLLSNHVLGFVSKEKFQEIQEHP